MARDSAARLVSRRSTAMAATAAPESDYQRVDLERVEIVRPRSVGAE